MNENCKKNHEGYTDLTPYKALNRIKAANKKAAYKPLVYVCSPYAGDVRKNTINARKYSRYVVEKDAIPITPHLMYPQFMDDKKADEREKARHFNYVLLGKCTEVWVFGGVVSRGMANEIAVAKRRKMKIRWFTEDLKEVEAYD